MIKTYKTLEDIPHDDVYVTVYGENYRNNPAFIQKVGEALHGTRDFGFVKADIRELAAFSADATYTPRGW